MKKFFVFVAIISVFFSCFVPVFAASTENATDTTEAITENTKTGLKPVVETVNATVLKLKKFGARRRALVEYNGKRYGAELSPETWIDLVPGDSVTVVVPTEWANRAYRFVYEAAVPVYDGSWYVENVVTNSAAYFAVVTDGNNTKTIEVPKNLVSLELGEKVEFTEKGELKYYEGWRSAVAFWAMLFLVLVLIGALVWLAVLMIKNHIR